MPSSEGLIKSGNAQRCGFVSGLIGCRVQVIQQSDLPLLPQQRDGVEIERHRDLTALRIVTVYLEVGPGHLQPQRGNAALRGAFHLHDLRERQLAGGGVILAVHAPVKQAYGKYPFEDQLAADDLTLCHGAANLAVQQFSSPLASGRKIHLLCKCKILFSDMC